MSFSVNLYANELSWQLRVDKQGIAAYTRKVDNSAILEFKSNVIINAPLDQVIHLFEDSVRMPEWYHQCVKMQQLNVESPLSQIYYFVLDLPFPVADRDVVFRRIKSIDQSTGAVTYELTALPDHLPKEKKKIRVTYLKTTWRFTPTADGKTEVYFQQHSDAGGSLPIFLANALVVDIPYNSLKNFRKLIE